MTAQDDELEKVRLDKWLWAARFYKTRSIATDAINGGKIHVNDSRAKPSRTVHVGDEITISRPPYKTMVIVLATSARRGPAKDAALLYRETAESAQAREELATQLRAQGNFDRSMIKGRPSKKNRRKIISFTRQGQE